MKPSAVLLIDLENFYHSRLDYFRNNSIAIGDQPASSDDLEAIVRYAEKLSGLPLAVRRAYANFNSLAITPRELMHRGIEPVQVFCLAETSNKNAADMKLAMDAMALAGSGAPFEHFVLVTGDADFIPVILELKNRGFGVSAIAVRGSTSPLIRRFVDGFKWFDDTGAPQPAVRPQNRLVAVRSAAPAAAPNTVAERAAETVAHAIPAPAAPAGPEELPRIAAALQQLLARSGPVRFNQVHRVLSKELGYSFDPMTFGASSTGGFLRRNAPALGVGVRGSANELEVYLPEPGTNGHYTTKTPDTVPQPPASAVPPEPHTAARYRELLATRREGSNETIVTVIPWDALVAVCDATVRALAPPAGGPTPFVKLVPALKAAGAPAEAGLIASALRGALPVPSREGLFSVPSAFTGATVRARLLRYIVAVLRTRLTDAAVPGPILPAALVEVFAPDTARPQVENEVAAALADPEPEPAPTPVPAPKRYSARVEAVHTAHGYRELFAAAPETGDATEEPALNPPPWPWFYRLCDEAFAILSPAAGGPCPPGDFQKRLNARAEEAGDPNFRSHVSRALPLLRLSNAVMEEDGVAALHPQVADPEDIRGAVLWALLRLLAARLRTGGVPGSVRADAFLAAIGAGPMTDDLLPQITQAIEEVEHEVAEAEPCRTEIQIEIVTEALGEPVPVVDPEPVDRICATRAPIAAEGECRAAPEREPEAAGADVPAEPPDRHAFDGSLPEFERTEPGHAATEEEPPAGSDEVPHEPTSSGDIDVAALTRAAVASATEPGAATGELQPCSAALKAPEIAPTAGERTIAEQTKAVSNEPPATATSEAPSEPVEHEEPAATEPPTIPTGSAGETPEPRRDTPDGEGENRGAEEEIPYADLVEDEPAASGRVPALQFQGAAAFGESAPPADAFDGVDKMTRPHRPEVLEPPLPPLSPGSA